MESSMIVNYKLRQNVSENWKKITPHITNHYKWNHWQVNSIGKFQRVRKQLHLYATEYYIWCHRLINYVESFRELENNYTFIPLTITSLITDELKIHRWFFGGFLKISS